jgi:hypothetical protein
VLAADHVVRKPENFHEACRAAAWSKQETSPLCEFEGFSDPVTAYRITNPVSVRMVTITNEPHITIRYQCSPHHTNSPFYPVINELEHAARFERVDAPDVTESWKPAFELLNCYVAVTVLTMAL